MRTVKADRNTRQAALDARDAAQDNDSGDEDLAMIEVKMLAVTPAAFTALVHGGLADADTV